MDVMTMGDLRLMTGALMIPGVVMFGGFAMMLSALVGHKTSDEA